MALDAFDPNNWDAIFAAQEHRIYADDYGNDYAVVDYEDWMWAHKLRWHVNKPHPKRRGKKAYLRTRAGWRAGGGGYLHVLIQDRKGEKRPSPKHVLTDHLDGNERNCTGDNLCYATHVRNRRTSKQKGGSKYVSA